MTTSGPPVAQDRVQLRPDGRVLVTLKTVWRDGPSPLLFEPIELLEKRAAITPRPAINWVLYHAVLACPRWSGRRRVIATVQDPLAVQAILAHLARSGAPLGPAPPAPAALT